MKTVKIALLTLTAVVSTNMLAMFNSKPQTAVGHAKEGIKVLRNKVKGAYAQTMQEAYRGNGEIFGLRSEVRGAVNDLKEMGSEVKGIADDVQGVADVGLELVEEELTKNGFFAKRPKLKRQINKIVAEVRTALPYLLTTAVVAWLGLSYIQTQKTGKAGVYTWITDKVGGVAVREKLSGILQSIGLSSLSSQHVATPVAVTTTAVQNPGTLTKAAIWTEQIVSNGYARLKKSIWG